MMDHGQRVVARAKEGTKMNTHFNPSMFASKGPFASPDASMHFDWKRFWLDTSKIVTGAGWGLKELTLVGIGVATLGVLEAFSASYAFEVASQRHLIGTPWGEYPREALQMSALTVTCGVAAFLFQRRSSLLLEDFRRDVRRRGREARRIALGFVAICIWYAGCAFTYEQRMVEHENYLAGPMVTEDRETLAGLNGYVYPDDRARAEGRVERLGAKPGTVNLPDIGPLGLAAFLHALVMWSAGAMRRPTKVTWQEREVIEDGYVRDDKKRALEQFRRDKLRVERQERSLGSWVLREITGLRKALLEPVRPVA